MFIDCKLLIYKIIVYHLQLNKIIRNNRLNKYVQNINWRKVNPNKMMKV